MMLSMANELKLFKHTDKDARGKYSAAPKCDCCGKPTNEALRYTDDEVCQGSDGPGFYLCHRKRCPHNRPWAQRSRFVVDAHYWTGKLTLRVSMEAPTKSLVWLDDIRIWKRYTRGVSSQPRRNPFVYCTGEVRRVTSNAVWYVLIDGTAQLERWL